MQRIKRNPKATKWTKFKEETPRDCYIYVTNGTSTWVSFNIQYWHQFALDNPDYAWAKIPIPATPVLRKKYGWSKE